jgi:hypothetical protein
MNGYIMHSICDYEEKKMQVKKNCNVQAQHQAAYMRTQMVNKNEWNCTSTSPYIFMAWRLVNHRDNLCVVLLNIPSCFSSILH